MVIDVSVEQKCLREIALGFVFEFYPIYLLEDSFADKQYSDAEQGNWYDWSSIFSDVIEWDEIIEGSRFYRRCRCC